MTRSDERSATRFGIFNNGEIAGQDDDSGLCFGGMSQFADDGYFRATAGTPTTTAPDATSRVTTAPAPIIAPSPIVTPGRITA